MFNITVDQEIRTADVSGVYFLIIHLKTLLQAVNMSTLNSQHLSDTIIMCLLRTRVSDTHG